MVHQAKPTRGEESHFILNPEDSKKSWHRTAISIGFVVFSILAVGGIGLGLTGIFNPSYLGIGSCASFGLLAGGVGFTLVAGILAYFTYQSGSSSRSAPPINPGSIGESTSPTPAPEQPIDPLFGSVDHPLPSNSKPNPAPSTSKSAPSATLGSHNPAPLAPPINPGSIGESTSPTPAPEQPIDPLFGSVDHSNTVSSPTPSTSQTRESVATVFSELSPAEHGKIQKMIDALCTTKASEIPEEMRPHYPEAKHFIIFPFDNTLHYSTAIKALSGNGYVQKCLASASMSSNQPCFLLNEESIKKLPSLRSPPQSVTVTPEMQKGMNYLMRSIVTTISHPMDKKARDRLLQSYQSKGRNIEGKSLSPYTEEDVKGINARIALSADNLLDYFRKNPIENLRALDCLHRCLEQLQKEGQVIHFEFQSIEGRSGFYTFYLDSAKVTKLPPPPKLDVKTTQHVKTGLDMVRQSIQNPDSKHTIDDDGREKLRKRHDACGRNIFGDPRANFDKKAIEQIDQARTIKVDESEIFRYLQTHPAKKGMSGLASLRFYLNMLKEEGLIIHFEQGSFEAQRGGFWTVYLDSSKWTT